MNDTEIIALSSLAAVLMYFVRWLQNRIKNGSVNVVLNSKKNEELSKENKELKQRINELEACKECNENQIKELQNRYFAEVDRKQLLTLGKKDEDS